MTYPSERCTRVFPKLDPPATGTGACERSQTPTRVEHDPTPGKGSSPRKTAATRRLLRDTTLPEFSRER
jgi:hypothetical protein